MKRLTALFALMLAACQTSPADQPAAVSADTLPLGAMSAAIRNGDYRKIEAVIVDQGGQIVFEEYYGSTTAETRIDARSAGKSITALAVGVAIDEGLIPGSDAPLFSFFPERAPFVHDGLAKQAITLHDVLSMSSALACDDWEDSPGNEERMYETEDWTRFALDIPLDTDFAEDESGQGRFSYCTAGAFLLGRVVERATGTAFDEFVQQKLFTPLGIEGAEWRRSPGGEVQSGGQLSLRARDFSRIGRLVLDRGQSDGETLVSRDWLREMLAPRGQATPQDAYGYLWWVRDFRVPGEQTPHPGFYMSGNGGNKVVVLDEYDAVVTILSTNYNQRDMHNLTTDILERHILPVLASPGGEQPE